MFFAFTNIFFAYETLPGGTQVSFSPWIKYTGQSIFLYASSNLTRSVFKYHNSMFEGLNAPGTNRFSGVLNINGRHFSGFSTAGSTEPEISTSPSIKFGLSAANKIIIGPPSE